MDHDRVGGYRSQGLIQIFSLQARGSTILASFDPRTEPGQCGKVPNRIVPSVRGRAMPRSRDRGNALGRCQGSPTRELTASVGTDESGDCVRGKPRPRVASVFCRMHGYSRGTTDIVETRKNVGRGAHLSCRDRCVFNIRERIDRGSAGLWRSAAWQKNEIRMQRYPVSPSVS